jgi:hypothetical protein
MAVAGRETIMVAPVWLEPGPCNARHDAARPEGIRAGSSRIPRRDSSSATQSTDLHRRSYPCEKAKLSAQLGFFLTSQAHDETDDRKCDSVKNESVRIRSGRSLGEEIHEVSTGPGENIPQTTADQYLLFATHHGPIGHAGTTD